MTDNYGNDPGHDETLGNEHAEVHEAPSDFEFSDETATASEHNDEQVMTSVAEAKPKGRSPLLPILAAVGGIVLLGGVAWWQFGGGFGTTQTTEEAAPPSLPHPQLAVASTPTSLPVTPKVSDAATGSVPDAGTVAPANLNPVTPAATDSPAPIPTINVTPASSPAPTPSPVAPISINTSPVPVPVTTGGADNKRIDDLAARMDDLQKSLNQLTQQLAQSGGAAAENKEIEERLTKLEEQTSHLHHNAPSLSAPVAVTASDDAGNMIVAPSSITTTKAPTHHKQGHETVTHKPATHHGHMPKPVIIEGKEPHWVLRAAVPGQAWIAANTTDKDLKPVNVGDNVPGIGRVTAIEPHGDSWIVEGTRGSIH